MMVNAELYVKDLPGQLVGSLEPISMVNGNIVGVVHDREQKTNQRILVSVTFNVPSGKDLSKLKSIWHSRDVIVSQIGSVYKTYSMNYMLLGKFNAAYVDSLIESISEKVDFESVDVSYSDSNGKRTAMITAEVKSEEDLDYMHECISGRSRKDGLIFIRGL